MRYKEEAESEDKYDAGGRNRALLLLAAPLFKDGRADIDLEERAICLTDGY